MTDDDYDFEDLKMPRPKPESERERVVYVEREPRGASGGNVLAALASFFVPGLGQLLQGRALTGFLFFLIVPAGWVVTVFTGGVLCLAPLLLHLWCIVDAAKYKA